MSQENVEIVRRHFDAYLAGDNESALAAYDPQVEFDVPFRPDGRVYRGREGVAEAMRVWSGTWDDWKVQIKETVDAGERVLVVLQESGRGKGSGIEIDQTTFLVFTLGAGKIVRMTGFTDRDRALEAAGIGE